MLFFFCGQDTFSRREAVAEVEDALGEVDMASLNTVYLDGAKLSADQLAAACHTAPFFTDRRLIIIAGLVSRFEPRDRRNQERSGGSKGHAKGEARSFAETFVDCLSQLPPSVDVVLEDDTVNGTNPLMKALGKFAKVRWFAPLRPSELPAWVERRIRANGGSVTPGAAKLLSETVGNNLWILAAEIEKLLVYRNFGKVTEDDVRLLVSYARDANVFAMVDALVERRADVALRLMDQLAVQGATSPYLLAMITRQFRLLIQAKELVQQGARSSDIRKILGISSDFVFDKAMRQLAGYSLEQLEGVYRSLLRVDTDSKTGRVDQEVALELLVVDLCRLSPQGSPRTRRSA